MNKKTKNKFAKFGNITYDCPGRDYANYKWDNKKKKWVIIKDNK
jgi:hypothetical protein